LKKQIFIQAGIALALVVVISVPLFIVKGDISRRLIKVQELRTQFTEQVKAENSFIALKEGASRGLAAKAVLDRFVPSRDTLINFPRGLVNVAAEFDLEASATFGGQTELPNGLLSLVIDIKTVGEYSNILAFLNTLEKSEYFFIVESVNLVHQIDDGKFESSISAKVFSKPRNIGKS